MLLRDSYSRLGFPVFKNLHDVRNFPQLFRYARFHCWCESVRLVKLAEVVIHHEQRDRVCVVLYLLRERAFGHFLLPAGKGSA